MSPKAAEATTDETPVDAPAEEAAPEAPAAPVVRNFTGTIEVYGSTESADVTPEGFESVLKEQIALPLDLSFQGGRFSISGGKVTSSSEGDAGKPESGLGRTIVEEEETS